MISGKYILSRIRWFMVVVAVWTAVLLVLVSVHNSTVIWKAAAVAMGLAFMLLVYYGYRKIYRPFMINNRVKGLFARGCSYEDIYHMEFPLSPEEEAMFHRFSVLMDKNKWINVSKKKSEYLALQNQINPHFLYNTLEGIRAEALIAGVDTIAEMTEALATYFRYTISQMNNLATLEDELANVENYYYIQHFRFGDRLALRIHYDCEEEEALRCQIPKLTLQPIVENAIYHGLENKIEQGHLDIKVTLTDQRLILTISDDGVGMKEEYVKSMNEMLSTLKLDEEEIEGGERGHGIAVRNVNNRIKLLFGEEYGIYVYSYPGAGTDVEITLPAVKD